MLRQICSIEIQYMSIQFSKTLEFETIAGGVSNFWRLSKWRPGMNKNAAISGQGGEFESCLLEQVGWHRTAYAN